MVRIGLMLEKAIRVQFERCQNRKTKNLFSLLLNKAKFNFVRLLTENKTDNVEFFGRQ